MIGLSLGLTSRRGGGSPASLFANGEPGVWYDPSDLTTLFQDTAGTVPVTTAGQPVGLVLDKSGRGNHVTQATAAARPTYGVEPLGGRRNILPRNQWDAIPIGALTTEYRDRGQYLAGPNASAGISVEIVGKGVTDGISWVDVRYYGTNTSGSPQFRNIGSDLAQKVPAGVTKVSISTWAQIVSGSLPSGTSVWHFLNGREASLATVIGPGIQFAPTATWQRYSAAGLAVPANMAEATQYGMFVRINAGTAIDVTLRIGGGQVEYGSTVTALQNAVSIYDVTEAGVPSLGYLSFDGVDDWLVTPTITPNTDKVQVFAGVRKLSDAVIGTVVELTAAGDGNNGGMYLRAPTSIGGANYQAASRGTINSATTATGFAAPVTNIVTFEGDIAGDKSALRVNQTAFAPSVADQGAGNYATAQMWIGCRGGTTLPFNGRIYGLIVRFGANLTADQITRTETWMNSKTGAY